jgi:hypothetical protein
MKAGDKWLNLTLKMKGSIFLQNVDGLSTDYTVLCPRRQFKWTNTVARLHAGHPQNQCSTLAGARDFPFLQSVKTASQCHLTFYTLDTGASFHGGKDDNCLPSSTKIKNCMNLCHFQGMVFNYEHRDKFALYPFQKGACSSVVVEALCYKLEGRRFETWWDEWIFQYT